MASSREPSPVTVRENAFSNEHTVFRSSRVMVLTFFRGKMPLLSTTTGIIALGSKPDRELVKSRFRLLSKSFKIR